MNALHDLYRAALSADAEFSRLLRETYGLRAREMRYRTSQQTPEVRTAGEVMVTAMDAWREGSRKMGGYA